MGVFVSDGSGHESLLGAINEDVAQRLVEAVTGPNGHPDLERLREVYGGPDFDRIMSFVEPTVPADEKTAGIGE